MDQTNIKRYDFDKLLFRISEPVPHLRRSGDRWKEYKEGKWIVAAVIGDGTILRAEARVTCGCGHEMQMGSDGKVADLGMCAPQNCSHRFAHDALWGN
jgi:hypothetical protein